ncbi:hypothetical protein D3C86_1648890 [compost metagenome]
MPFEADAAIRLNALLIGDVISPAVPTPDVKSTLVSDDGLNCANVKPPLLRMKLSPTSLSTVLLISTTFTSTCTVPETGSVERSTTTPPGLPSAPLAVPPTAARAACWARYAAAASGDWPLMVAPAAETSTCAPSASAATASTRTV